MSAEKFFCGRIWAFLFAFWALFGFLYGVFGAVYSCSSVTFNVGMRDVSCWLA